LNAEKATRFPDLSLGVLAEAEPGFDDYSVAVPLGISLPLWNSNSEAIADAAAEAEAARAAFKAGLDAAVTDVYRNFAGLGRLTRRLTVLDGEILPAHRAALEEAHSALKVADFEPLRYVEMERAMRELQEERNALLEEVLIKRIDMEETVGFPMFGIPELGETKEKKK
jgi:outer membrane protein TolC